MALTVQLLLLGALTGTGLLLLLRELAPTTPDLHDATTRLTRTPTTTARAVTAPPATTLVDRVGLWLLAQPGVVTAPGDDRAKHLFTPPAADLAIMDRTPATWLGQKAVYGLVGLLSGPVLALLASLLNLPLPLTWLTPLTLGLAALLFFAPDLSVRTEAVKARQNAVTAVVSYIDLVSLERRAGSADTKALTRAAEVAHSWVFLAIRTQLQRAAIAGQPSWAALRDLGERIGILELQELADILRISGDQDSAIVPALLAKAQSLRTRELTRAQGRANAATERLAGPVVGLAVVFMLIVMYPAAIALLGTP